MPICRKCNEKFPHKMYVDGKVRNLCKRKFCLSCSPFGNHNTRADIDNKLDKDARKELVCQVCNKTRFEKSRNLTCNTCRAKIKRSEHRNKAIELLGSKCQECQYHKCPAVLDFHHKESGLKEFQISDHWHWSWKRLLPEIMKCSLLCSNCHRELHFNARSLSS